MIHISFLSSPIGKIGLAAENGRLIRVFFSASELPDQWLRDESDRTLVAAGEQLLEYFSGRRRRFELPVEPRVTAFAAQVLRETEKIPFGETVTYGELAARIGRPTANRAVGGALHKNPLPIVIPCHRVVAANGRQGGYAYGKEMKQMLLRLEEHFLSRS